MADSHHYKEPLQAIWLDEYGHLNTAYYQVPFSRAIWDFQGTLGIGEDYFEATGGALYTVESHTRYVRDVRAPAVMEVETFVLAFDERRIHLAQTMRVDAIERATFEVMSLHVDSRQARASALPEHALSALSKYCRPEAQWPAWTGARISMHRTPAAAQ